MFLLNIEENVFVFDLWCGCAKFRQMFSFSIIINTIVYVHNDIISIYAFKARAEFYGKLIRYLDFLITAFLVRKIPV